MSIYGSCPHPFITYQPHSSLNPSTPSTPYRPASLPEFPFLPSSSIAGLQSLICARLASEVCSASAAGVRRCRDARRDVSGWEGREGVERWNLAMGLEEGQGDGEGGYATETDTQESRSWIEIATETETGIETENTSPSDSTTRTKTQTQIQTEFTTTTIPPSSSSSPSSLPTGSAQSSGPSRTGGNAAEVTSDGSPFGISSGAVRAVGRPKGSWVWGMMVAVGVFGYVTEMLVV